MYFHGLGIACFELQQLQHCNNCIIICVFSCRRLTPFRPSNLTIAYPYGKG